MFQNFLLIFKFFAFLYRLGFSVFLSKSGVKWKFWGKFLEKSKNIFIKLQNVPRYIILFSPRHCLWILSAVSYCEVQIVIEYLWENFPKKLRVFERKKGVILKVTGKIKVYGEKFKRYRSGNCGYVYGKCEEKILISNRCQKIRTKFKEYTKIFA